MKDVYLCATYRRGSMVEVAGYVAYIYY